MIQRIARLTPSVKDGIRYSEEKKKKKKKPWKFFLNWIHWNNFCETENSNSTKLYFTII